MTDRQIEEKVDQKRKKSPTTSLSLSSCGNIPTHANGSGGGGGRTFATKKSPLTFVGLGSLNSGSRRIFNQIGLTTISLSPTRTNIFRSTSID